MEIFLSVLIVFVAGYILFKNIIKKYNGTSCDCGSCSSHCPNYKNKNN